MKTITYSAIATLLSFAPAAAHEGVHLHPHGFEGVVAGLALIGLAGGATLVRAGLRK